jgi:cytochrome c oxidase cbb3-type subunit I/II
MKLQTPIAALVTGLGVLLLAVVATPSAAQESHIGNLTGNAATGQKLYKRSCIGCHGINGDGAGENAQWIDPKPRDFTAALFKCRSTPTGTLPTDEDLFNAMSRGFVTTNMPMWLPLAAQNRADLVAYIKTFSPRWTTEKPGTPITVPAEPGVTAEGILRGRQTFQKLECWKCHGPTGNADGPSASTLTDSKGNPILPYNFAAGWSRFMCGSTNADVYRDFMTGLDGSPMPSFADNLQPAEAWDLVHFLRTLQPQDSPEARVWSAWMATHGKELKPIGPDNGQ